MITTEPEEWLIDGKTVYCLHESGHYTEGKPQLCNKFWFTVQPDYDRGITDEMAEEEAKRIHAALTIIDTLAELFN